MGEIIAWINRRPGSIDDVVAACGCQPALSVDFIGVIGGWYWTRTSDPCDVNTVLYQLS